jgi:PKD repeat protein
MRKTKTLLSFLILFLLLGWNNSLFSQISEGGIPPSFAFGDMVMQQKKDKQPFLAPISFDVGKLMQEDITNAANNKPPRIGVIVPLDLKMADNGEWITLPNGQLIWQLAIKAQGAIATSLYYDEFYIPEGGKLFIYNKDKTHIIGAYTNAANPMGKEFSTELVAGDEVILEYVSIQGATNPSDKIQKGMFESLKPSDKKEDSPRISISGINYGYNHLTVQYNEDLGDSGSCEVNINCAEGANWQNQKTGVFKTVVNDGYDVWICSGAVVNNTRQDLDPLLLTACHCIDGTTASNLNTTQFYFHYEQPGCDDTETDIPSTKSMVGATLLVANNISGGSDGALLRMNQNIPQNYNIYYNGWDATSIAATSGVGIHHPLGDAKKISTFTSTLTSDTWSSQEGTGATNAHWYVNWIQTANGHGVTEGGSSGSPLFNQEGLIVGTLTGGPGQWGVSACDLPPYSLYGKLWYHWDQHASVSNHMKTFLDPDNTGLTKVPGTYTGAVAKADFSTDKVNVYASGSVHFKSESILADTYKWTFDGGTPATATTKEVDVIYNTPGSYSVSLTINEGTANEDTKTASNYITVTEKTGEEKNSIIIGDGTSTSEFPLGANQQQSFSSSIYTAAELGNKGQTITELAWEATSSVACTRTIYVYLKEVSDDTQTAATWADEINGATLVYQSPATWINIAGWNLIKLNTPFVYSGTNNLKVIVHSSTPNTTGFASADVKYTDVANTHMSWTSASAVLPTAVGTIDGNRPNIKIKSSSASAPVTPVAKFAFPETILSEGFDGDGFPPQGWTIESPGVSDRGKWITGNNEKSFSAIDPNNKVSALVPYDIEKIIDTRLISPEVEIKDNTRLEFYALYGGYYGEGIITLNVSTDGGTTWNQEHTIGGVEDSSLPSDWRKQNVDLSAYWGQTVKLQFRYYGIGNLIGIDGINLYSPKADGEAIEIYEGEYIYPINMSTGPAVDTKWTFEGGDPNTSSDENPAIQYTKAGKYDITLSVRNTQGIDEVTHNEVVIVSARPPIVEFTAKGGYTRQENWGLFIPANSSVKYTEQIKNYPESFEWTFEGGTPATSTDSPVDVSYAAKGKYDFSLSATNSAGTDELSIPEYVQVGDKANIWNVPKDENAEFAHELANNGGYATGTNNADIVAFAEKFGAPPTGTGEVASIDILFEKVSSSSENIVVAVYTVGSDGMPSTAITQTQLNVDDIVDGDYTTVTFDKPASISSGFFVVVTAPETAQIAIKSTDFDKGTNTAYVYEDFWGIGWIYTWYSFPDFFGVNLSLNIVPSFTYSELEIDKHEIQINDKSTKLSTITVTSNVYWEAIPSESWIKITDVTDNTFKVSCSQNKLEYRSGYITVLGGGVRETITVEQSVAAPLNLTAEANGEHDVDLKWEKEFAISTDIFEDFESHEAFTIASGGEFNWGYIDGDGFSTYGFKGIDFPNTGALMSFMVFDPSQTNPAMTTTAGIQPHSGDKFLACFSSPDGALNDWFISPKLNFEREFKFSFWAKTYIDDYGLESFRVMYSTSDNGDFVELSESPYLEAPANWTRFEYTVPADAKYVAINCISNDIFIFMIDDVFIGVGNSPARLEIQSTPSGSSTTVDSKYQKAAKKAVSIYPAKDPKAIMPDGILNGEPKARPSISGLSTSGVSIQSADKSKTILQSETISAANKVKAYIPQNPSNRLMKWHDGIPYRNIGAGGSEFEAAIKFEASDLARYLDYKLTSVEMYVNEAATYVLKIYKNGEVIAYQPLDNIVAGQINRIDLRAPILIDDSFDELMISYEVSDYSGYPATADGNATITGSGGLVYLGGEWYNLPDAGIAGGNWIMTGIAVKEEKDAEVSYKLYRNDEYIATTDDIFYTDEAVELGGDICYTVTATQKNDSNIESAKSEKACVTLKHLLKVKANDIERIYGEENPDVTGEYTITGFIDNDTDAKLSAKPAVSIDPHVYHMYLQTGTYENAVVVADAADTAGKYRFTYQNGSLIIKDFNNDASLNMIEIDGTAFTDVPESYALNCNVDTKEVTIKVIPVDPKATVQLVSQSSTIRILDNIITVSTDKPSKQKVVFAIVAEDGITKEEFNITVEKYFASEDIIVTRWNNTMTVINNPKNNGGYKFVAFKWYRNGAEISTSQSYTAESNVGADDTYYVEVTTDQGDVLRTCVFNSNLKSLTVKAYPNPVVEGETVYVNADLDNSMLQNAVIEVYNTSGTKVQEVKVTGQVTPITIQSASGTYIFRFRNDQGYSKEMKVIKQ